MSSTVQTGFLDRTIRVAGKARRFQVYVPANFTPKQQWPVILFLHGAGERGDDGLIQTEVGIGTAIRRFANRFPAIVVFPQVPTGQFWSGEPAEAAMRALRAAQKEFNGDPACLYLTGLSMGGAGSWSLAYHHPNVFAAALVVCGLVSLPPHLPSIPPPDDGSPHTSTYDRIAARLTKLPTWIVHGEADAAVPVLESRRMHEALKQAGGIVHYTEIPGTNHNTWDATYQSESIVQWLFAQRRADARTKKA